MDSSSVSNNYTSLLPLEMQEMNNNASSSVLEQFSQTDELFHETVPRSRTTTEIIPTFDKTWLQLGRHLGKGNFCRVEEINSISLPRCLSQNLTTTTEDAIRNLFANPSILESNGRPRYAIKHLRKVTKNDPKRRRDGLHDLALESKILTRLQHPHIIKLHGISSAGQHSVNNFLILDCLCDTLDKRLRTWRKTNNQRNTLIGKIIGHASGMNRSIPWECLDRVQDACNISAALVHIHENEIIHRDLKPENIGYDITNNIKIFDFGFAKQLIDDKKNADGTYKLSWVGTLRYMAPEVGLFKPYGTGCDVYSFAILLWEIIQLERPFSYVNTHDEFVQRVFDDDERPPLGLSWSRPIKNLLTRSWSANAQSRMTIIEVHEQLCEILQNMRDGDDIGF